MNLYSAKYAPPIGKWSPFGLGHFNHTSKYSKTLFVVPSGCLMTEELAASLKEQGKEMVWLRMTSTDYDPGSCLLDITHAAKRLHPQIGTSTINEMQQFPGPIYGWSRLFEGLAEDFRNNLPAETALVFEGLQVFTVMHPYLIRRISKFLEQLPEGMERILISHQALPPGMLSGWYGVRTKGLLLNDEKVSRLKTEPSRQRKTRLSKSCLSC